MSSNVSADVLLGDFTEATTQQSAPIKASGGCDGCGCPLTVPKTYHEDVKEDGRFVRKMKLVCSTCFANRPKQRPRRYV